MTTYLTRNTHEDNIVPDAYEKSSAEQECVNLAEHGKVDECDEAPQ